MVLNSWSQTGKAPQPTTLSMGDTAPLSIHTSNTSTMDGLTLTWGGSTVYTLWSTYSQRGGKQGKKQFVSAWAKVDKVLYLKVCAVVVSSMLHG